MCGRYLLIAPVGALRRLFGVTGCPNLAARYNIAPTQEAAVVRIGADGRELAKLRWGLVPYWTKDTAIGANLINARVESLAEKPSFRAAFQKRRCLVPADRFYEWQAPVSGKGAKQPYLIARRDRETFAFAGLWEHWQGAGKDGMLAIESFTIVTTDANATLKPIHRRMPVILDRGDYEAWLDIENALAGELLKPAPDDALSATPILTRVNAARNDCPDVMAPAEAVVEKTSASQPPAEPSRQGRLF